MYEERYKAVLGCETWKMVSANVPLGISAGKCLTGSETHLCFWLLPETLGRWS